MTLVLDAGALLAVEWRNRDVVSAIRAAHDEGIPVRPGSGAVTQTWQNGARQGRLARALRGIDERPIDASASRRIGRLLADSGTSDVVDAHVATLCEPDAVVLTSDPEDLDHLLAQLGQPVTITRV